MPSEEKKINMLTIQQIADSYEGLSYYTVRELIVRNKFTGYIKTGCKYLINQEMFEKFLRGEMNNKE